MTNGEKMRKMTDKELAEKITSLIYIMPFMVLF